MSEPLEALTPFEKYKKVISDNILFKQCLKEVFTLFIFYYFKDIIAISTHNPDIEAKTHLNTDIDLQGTKFLLIYQNRAGIYPLQRQL